MPSPRDCRACGAPLAGNVRWCLRCYEPVRELTPREPQLPPLPAVYEPTPEPRTSRWHAGPTTFGPVGRVVSTLVLALFAPWQGLGGFDSAGGPLMLWWTLGYTVLTVLLLRSIWRKERVADPAIASRPDPKVRLARHAPTLARPVKPMLLLGALGVLGLVSLALLWVNLDTQGRYYLVAIGGTTATGVFLVIWNEL